MMLFVGSDSNSAVVISRVGPDVIPALQPLWEALHAHHVEVAPHLRELGPVRPAAESWKVREALYREWLNEPDAFVVLAQVDRAPIGYALVHMRGEEESWQTGPRIAELETLAVMPEHRGRGIGMRLIDAVYGQLRTLGVQQLGVSVISTNSDAIRFYDRLGLLQFCVSYLTNIPQIRPSTP